LLPGRACVHPRVEGLGLGLARLADVFGLLGPGGADERGKNDGSKKGKLHDGLERRS
jgi:hypothetical protein